MKLCIAYVLVSSLAAGPAFAQDRTGSNPAAQNPREKSDAPQKDPKVLSDREVEDLLPRSQSGPTGKDPNKRADANDTWIEWFADLVDEEDQGKPSADQNGKEVTAKRASSVDRFVSQYDSNGDGAVARKELPNAMRHGFKQIDRDQNGQLSADEVRRHVDRQRLLQTPVAVTHVWLLEAHDGRTKLEDLQEAYSTLKRVDDNSDGKITRSELQSRRKEIATKMIDQCFQNHDDNNDNQLTRQEAHGTAIASRFKKYDSDDDGRVAKKELREALIESPEESRSKAGSKDESGQ